MHIQVKLLFEGVYIRVEVFMCMYTRVSACANMFVCMCMCTCVCVRVHVCMCVFMYVCTYVCLFVCM